MPRSAFFSVRTPITQSQEAPLWDDLSDSRKTSVARAPPLEFRFETVMNRVESFTRSRFETLVILARALLLGVTFLTTSTTLLAAEVALRGSSLQLPLEGYQRLAFSLQLGLGNRNQGLWYLEAGVTPPFRISSYTQTVALASIGKEWTFTQNTWLQPFAGIGLGAYADQVTQSGGDSSFGWMPTWVTRAGIRTGGQRFGIHLLFESHAGVYDFSQLTSWVIWPLVRLSGGLHVSF